MTVVIGLSEVLDIPLLGRTTSCI